MACDHPEAHRMRFTDSIGEKKVLCGVCAKNITNLDHMENMEENGTFDPTDPTQLSSYWREGGDSSMYDDLDFEDI